MNHTNYYKNLYQNIIINKLIGGAYGGSARPLESHDTRIDHVDSAGIKEASGREESKTTSSDAHASGSTKFMTEKEFNDMMFMEDEKTINPNLFTNLSKIISPFWVQKTILEGEFKEFKTLDSVLDIYLYDLFIYQHKNWFRYSATPEDPDPDEFRIYILYEFSIRIGDIRSYLVTLDRPENPESLKLNIYDFPIRSLTRKGDFYTSQMAKRYKRFPEISESEEIRGIPIVDVNNGLVKSIAGGIDIKSLNSERSRRIRFNDIKEYMDATPLNTPQQSLSDSSLFNDYSQHNPKSGCCIVSGGYTSSRIIKINK